MAQSGFAVPDSEQVILDRSRVRILLCDKDPVAGQEVSDLLRRCSYQVTAVRTARQVARVLQISSSEIDLILAEVELPNKKAFKMLKYIKKAEHMKHIPVVMMSDWDDMAVVVKCLRLGAADYLVKPLRVNELLNLWTHMWRRRRMLGIAERNLIRGSFNVNDIPLDLFVLDTSVSNTMSTDIFSESSIDKNFTISADATSTIAAKKCQFEASQGLELPLLKKSNAASASCRRKECRLFSPKKIELKAGEFSAFLSYTRQTNPPCKSLQTVVPNKVKISDQHVSLDKGEQLVVQNSLGAKVQHTNLNTTCNALLGSEKDEIKPGKTCIEAGEGMLGLERQQKNSEGFNGHSRCNKDAGDCLDAVEADRQQTSRYSNTQMGAENGHPVGVPFFPLFPSSHVMLQGFVPSLHHTAPLVPPALPFYHSVQHDNSSGIQSGPPLKSFPSHHVLPSPYYVPLPGQLGHHPIWPMLSCAPVSQSSTCLAERRKAALSKLKKKRKHRYCD